MESRTTRATEERAVMPPIPGATESGFITSLNSVWNEAAVPIYPWRGVAIKWTTIVFLQNCTNCLIKAATWVLHLQPLISVRVISATRRDSILQGCKTRQATRFHVFLVETEKLSRRRGDAHTIGGEPVGLGIPAGSKTSPHPFFEQKDRYFLMFNLLKTQLL